MNEEEKKAVELLEDIKNNSWTTKYIMSSDSKNAELLLNLIEKLQRENEELKKFITEGITVAPHSTYKNYRLDFLRENFVSKKKVKDKIEELNRKIDKSIDNSKGGLDEEFIEKAGELLTQKRILQELLEKEK